jgi:hypothetical protein
MKTRAYDVAAIWAVTSPDIVVVLCRLLATAEQITQSVAHNGSHDDGG